MATGSPRLFFNRPAEAEKWAGFVERRWAAGMPEGEFEFVAAMKAVVETPKNL